MKQLRPFVDRSLRMRNDLRFSVDGFCYLFWILMLLLLPVHWVAGWFLAAAVHEMGHLLMLYLCGTKIYSIQVGAFGAQIETEAIHPIAEAVCAFSGPAIGFLTVMLRENFPHAAISAVVQSAYNMIPVFPLDGGRVILALLNYILPQKTAIKIARGLSYVVIVCIIVCGVCVSFKYHLGIWPVIFPAMPILLTVRKNSLHCGQKNSTILKRKI